MLHPVPGLMENTTPQFRDALIALAGRIGADPTALAAVMAFETGKTFRANVRNAKSGAVGLIQFLPSTARNLGTTVEALARLSPIDQLPWVERYFRYVGAAGKLRTVADHYAAVFAPAHVGKPDTQVLYRSGDAYTLNAPLDQNRDHAITKAEAARYVVSFYNQAKELAPVAKEGPSDSLTPFPDRSEPASLAGLSAALADLRQVVELRCDELDGKLNALQEEFSSQHADLREILAKALE